MTCRWSKARQDAAEGYICALRMLAVGSAWGKDHPGRAALAAYDEAKRKEDKFKKGIK